MAELQVNLSNIQKVIYQSSSQGQIEPSVVQFGNVAIWARPYTLTIPALPAGVASCTVRRSSSQFTGAQLGQIVAAGMAPKTVTVYYGDVLSISATAAHEYNSPTATLSQTTVKDDVSATIRSGTAYSWHTLFSGSEGQDAVWGGPCNDELITPAVPDTRLKISLTGTTVGVQVSTSKSVSGLVDGRQTRINVDGKNTMTGTGTIAFPNSSGKETITVGNNALTYKATPYSYTTTSEGGWDECGNYFPGTTTIHTVKSFNIYITKIEQFY